MQNIGTVPTFKMHSGRTVPTFKMHNVGTVPTFKMHNEGTVPMYITHNIGTQKFYDFFEFEFGLFGKNEFPLVVSVFLSLLTIF